MKEDQYSIRVSFYKYDGRKIEFIQYCWDKTEILISNLTFDNVHVHAEITDNEYPRNTWVANYLGVNKGERPREFSSEGYTSPHTINLKKNEYDKIRKFMIDSEGTKFNYWGYYVNFLPTSKCFPSFQIDEKGKSYFCIEFVISALKHIGMFTEIEAYNITTEEFLQIIRNDNRFYTSISEKSEKILYNQMDFMKKSEEKLSNNNSLIKMNQFEIKKFKN